ncbi:hypothetical protein [Candidatus Marinarcus aquaticus]|uniref:hypothetical protein n=1 Tax=Candidatus Marinarcus aquaticus TaxID=2044504 RepID=UPI0013E93E58|nr:hypothetical protein [Candidatus Marinarcus aquaticus]
MSTENKKRKKQIKQKEVNQLVQEVVYIDKKLIQKVKNGSATKEEEVELLLKI